MSKLVNLTLTVRKRAWFDAVFGALAVACAFVDLFSPRAANRLSGAGVNLIAKYGFRFEAH